MCIYHYAFFLEKYPILYNRSFQHLKFRLLVATIILWLIRGVSVLVAHRKAAEVNFLWFLVSRKSSRKGRKSVQLKQGDMQWKSVLPGLVLRFGRCISSVRDWYSAAADWPACSLRHERAHLACSCNGSLYCVRNTYLLHSHHRTLTFTTARHMREGEGGSEGCLRGFAHCPSTVTHTLHTHPHRAFRHFTCTHSPSTFLTYTPT